MLKCSFYFFPLKAFLEIPLLFQISPFKILMWWFAMWWKQLDTLNQFLPDVFVLWTFLLCFNLMVVEIKCASYRIQKEVVWGYFSNAINFVKEKKLQMVKFLPFPFCFMRTIIYFYLGFLHKNEEIRNEGRKGCNKHKHSKINKEATDLLLVCVTCMSSSESSFFYCKSIQFNCSEWMSMKVFFNA